MKLVVTDTVTMAADSIIIPVYVFYGSIWVDAGTDTIVRCSQELIQLSANTNFPVGLFEWLPPEKFKNPYQQHAKVLLPENRYFTVKMLLENCMLMDSVKMLVQADDRIIASDTMFYCYSSPITLTVPSGYYSILWSTGATTPSISVSKTGTYAVRMQKNSCMATDTIKITGTNPISSYKSIADTVLCKGEQLSIQIHFDTVLWSDGLTSNMRTINQSGLYWVKINSGTCEVIDTFKVKKLETDVLLTDSTTLCEGSFVELTPTVTGLPTSYLWSNGSTDNILRVTQAGNYILTISEDICKASAGTIVTSYTLPKTFLTSDTFYCGTNVLTLSLPDSFDSYLWSTGNQTNTLQPTIAGWYWVQVSKRGCPTTDSIFVEHKEGNALYLGSDTTFCKNFLLQLDGGAGVNYQWLPYGETTRTILATAYGDYILIRTDTQNCVSSDTIKITEYCEPVIFVPNVFTPEGNGINETFLPIIKDLTEYHLLIYNRWGEVVFETTSPTEGWNGKYKDKPAQQDAYMWVIIYRGTTKETKDRTAITGTVTLLR